jgi:polyisoprenoid-binding protein YceI
LKPVAEIDNRLIGDGKAGMITKQLKTFFEAVVRGKDQKFGIKWLTPIK